MPKIITNNQNIRLTYLKPRVLASTNHGGYNGIQTKTALTLTCHA